MCTWMGTTWLAASVNGDVHIAGVSEGDYLVTLPMPGMRRGLHATVHIVPGRSAQSAQRTRGGVIRDRPARYPRGADAKVQVIAVLCRSASDQQRAADIPAGCGYHAWTT